MVCLRSPGKFLNVLVVLPVHGVLEVPWQVPLTSWFHGCQLYQGTQILLQNLILHSFSSKSFQETRARVGGASYVQWPSRGNSCPEIIFLLYTKEKVSLLRS